MKWASCFVPHKAYLGLLLGFDVVGLSWQGGSAKFSKTKKAPTRGHLTEEIYLFQIIKNSDSTLLRWTQTRTTVVTIIYSDVVFYFCCILPPERTQLMRCGQLEI